MRLVNSISPLKIVVALRSEEEASILHNELECMGHRLQLCRELGEAVRWIRMWQPDLLITDENFAKGAENGGLRLVELSRMDAEQGQGSFRTQSLILVPSPDWDRVRRAQATGAHAIVKSQNFDAVVRYVQTVVDGLTTDRILGPVLFGIHRFHGEVPQRFCQNCEWVGASLAHGSSQTDVLLPAVRATVLNCLLLRRRGLSAEEIAAMIEEHRFLESILREKTLRQSAIKMEISRLRQDVEEALRRIGSPYCGNHFLPLVQHGFERYRLAGNWHLSHVPIDA